MKGSTWAVIGGIGLAALFIGTQDSEASEEKNNESSPPPEGGDGQPVVTDSSAPIAEKAEIPPQDKPALKPQGSSIYTQAEIITATWQVAKTGESGKVEEIKAVIGSLLPELQAYFVTAAKYVYEAYELDKKFRNEFVHEFDEANKHYQNYQNGIDIALGAVAGAANAIPAIGQVVSAILALAIAIKRWALAGKGPEPRDIADNEHIFRDWEDSDCLRGLRIEGNSAPTKQNLAAKIGHDLIAGRLPEIKRAYKFEFTPTIEQFRAVAKKAGLYSENYLRQAYGFTSVWKLEGSDDFPTTAAEILNYSIGYQLGQLGNAYENDYPWGRVGYSDALEKRPMRVSEELQAWANRILDA